MTYAFEFKCPLIHGLHARPATSLVEFCESFEADISCLNQRTGASALTRSVLALLSADIRHGDICEITVDGIDAKDAGKALEAWLANELPHCDDELDLDETQVVGADMPLSLSILEPPFLSGQGLSMGIGQGMPVVLSGPRFPTALLEQTARSAEEEWHRLTTALVTAIQRLEADVAVCKGAEKAVLQAHLAILQDEEYSSQLRQTLFEASVPLSAARAIALTVEHFEDVLGQTGNPYLQERILDIQDVSQRLMQAVYGDIAQAPRPELQTDSVVVADALTPGDFISLNGPFLKGLILESGGKTSHTVLLARAAGIPALGGVAHATAFAKSSTGPLILDAGAGLLLMGENQAILDYYRRETDRLETIETRLDAFANVEARTADGFRIEVAANISLPGEAESAFVAGAEGIGLFRTEMLFVGQDEPPSEQQQYEAYRQVVEAAQGKPVIIRTFDVGGDKQVPWLDAGSTEENPFLGVRGARLYPKTEMVFRTQLRAMLRAAQHGDVQIMLPMISLPEELRWARGVIEEVRSELEETTGQVARSRLGIMIEVPSAAYSIDKLAPMCDFFSIGSNDLAQYFFAADRGNEQLSNMYSHFHRAFLRLLRFVLDEARTHGVYTGLCGDMASDERALPLLVGLGLDEISLTAPQIRRTKAGLAQLDTTACRNLLDQLVSSEDSHSVRQELEKFQIESTGGSLFAEELVVFEERAESKVEVIKQMVDRVHLAGRTDQVAALETAIWQREEVFSTGLGFGIAIPHCKSAAVRQNSLCVARYRQPLDWQSRDGEPVDTVIMLIVRESDAGEAHMKIFAQLARSIMHESFREGLRACPDERSLLQYLQAVVKT